MDKISGTTGLIGCADGSLILEKENRLGTQGSLTVTSREHPDKKLLLDFDREKKIWKFLSYADSQEEESEDPILAAVGIYLQDKPSWKGTATELLEALLKINPSILAKPNSLVRKLNAKTRELSDRYGIRYLGRREENVKYLILERTSDTSDTCDISATTRCLIIVPIAHTARRFDTSPKNSAKLHRCILYKTICYAVQSG